MAWAIITIYTSKCAQMDPQQPPKTSKFYSRCKKCDIEKTLGVVGTTPLGSPKVTCITSGREDVLPKPLCCTSSAFGTVQCPRVTSQTLAIGKGRVKDCGQ